MKSMSLQNFVNAPGARLIPGQPIILLLAP